VVAGGAHSGNFLAFAGGWFKSQLGYLNFSSVKFRRHWLIGDFFAKLAEAGDYQAFLLKVR
jgi:hypothetical protein